MADPHPSFIRRENIGCLWLTASPIFRELVPVVELADRPVGVDGFSALVTALRCYEPVAIYLFGSRVCGTARPDSDFDLALFLGDGRSLPIDEWFTASERLRTLTGSEVDLVVLDEARPHVQVEILRTGKVLYESNPVDRQVLEKRVLDQYGDVRALAATLIGDIEDCLGRLARFVPAAGEAFPAEPDSRALAHHYLWRACQGVLDLARLIARNVGGPGWEAGRITYRQVFTLLGQQALLPPGLVQRGYALTDLRNKLVHEYLVLRPAEMGRILRRHVPAMGEILLCLAGASGVTPERSRLRQGEDSVFASG